MNFLSKIDKIYNIHKYNESTGVTDDNFISYIDYIPTNFNVTKEFLIKKQKKSKLLIVDRKQRIYLSDIDIINIILKLEENDFFWLMDKFVKLYRNEGFIIESELGNSNIIEYKGIPEYSTDKKLNIFTDSEISINDLIYLMNFIFAKDYVWGDYTNNIDLINSTLRKYLSLSDYNSKYKINAKESSEKYLKDINENIELLFPTDTNKNGKKTKYSMKSFDISMYTCYNI